MSGSPIALLEGRFFASLLPFIRIISQLPPKTKIFTAAAGAQYNFPRICMAEGKAETAPTIFTGEFKWPLRSGGFGMIWQKKGR